MTIEQALQAGLTHHRAGRLPQAETIYRQVLAREPNQADALHLLGVVLRNSKQPVMAITLLKRALEVKPRWADAWYNLGNAYRDTGQTDFAVTAFRRAIEFKPQFVDAWINLGNLLIERGMFDEAVGCFQKAILLRPSDAHAFGNLGNALMGKKDFEAAVTAYRQAISLVPDFYQAMSNLGISLKELGKAEEAIPLHHRAIEICPQYAQAYRNLGSAEESQGRMDAAKAAYQRAVEVKPDYAEAHMSLGDLLRDAGQLDEAIAAYRSAIALKPDNPQVHTNLGNVLKRTGKFAEAVAAHRRAIDLDPDFAEAYSNLGNVLKDGWKIDEALVACQKAISLKPDFANAYGNLGQALLLGGQLDAAMAATRRVIELEPDNADVHGGYIFSLHYVSDCDARTIAREQALWNQRHAEPLMKSIVAHCNNRDPDRRLRVGYVSADFWAHPVGRFLLPLFHSHDQSKVEIFVYSQATVMDSMTDELKAFASGWRAVVGLSDAQMADQIRDDRIDILMDLSLHTAGNRLLVFARKPAPVQMTWLGYPGSTGLKTIDYRISDPYLDPIDSDETVYSEQTLRLPETYWCYRQSAEAGEVARSPASQQGHVTFGCLNHFGKVSPRMLELWAKILSRLPDARLLLHVTPGDSRRRVLERFEQMGIAADRLQFEGRVEPRDYFKLYSRIDIALDTSPFAGGTTTCDALWMGVAVVTLKGSTVTGRGGYSILSNVGLPELVAGDEDSYVTIATELAGDLPRLEILRSELRRKMIESPLMDAPRFARNMEAAYLFAWRRWCSNPS